MAIIIDGKSVKKIYHGSNSVKQVWFGGNKVWSSGPSWEFTDSFTGTALSNYWSTSGGIAVSNGYATKNNSNGSSDAWCNTIINSDEVAVEVIVGAVGNNTESSSVLIGDQWQYVYAEFNKNGGLIGEYDGKGWLVLQTYSFGSPLANGDVISLRRKGRKVQWFRNGELLWTKETNLQPASSYSAGFSVRRSGNLFSANYSPTIDLFRFGTP